VGKRWLRPYRPARPKRKYLLDPALILAPFPFALFQRGRKPVRKAWLQRLRIKRTPRISVALLQAPAAPFPDELLKARKRRRLRLVVNRSERTATIPIPAEQVVDLPVLLRTVTTYARPPPRKKSRRISIVLIPPPPPAAIPRTQKPRRIRKPWWRKRRPPASVLFQPPAAPPPFPDALLQKRRRKLRRYARQKPRRPSAAVIAPPVAAPPFPNALLTKRPYRRRRNVYVIRTSQAFFAPSGQIASDAILIRRSTTWRKTWRPKPRRSSAVLFPPPTPPPPFPAALLARKKPSWRKRRRPFRVKVYLLPIVEFPEELLRARRKARI